jgi:putative hemolysin
MCFSQGMREMEDAGMGMGILLILVLLIANGAFALSELAIVSARKARLQQRAADGQAGARRALELIEHPNRFLATVQIGITLIGILAGAYGGATLAEQLGRVLEGIPSVAPYGAEIAFGLVVVSITYLSLVIGELVPKRIALGHPERIAVAVARPMHALSVAATPIVKLLSLSTDAMLRLLRVPKSDDTSVTEEEIATMIEEGARAGVLATQEKELLHRIIELGDRQVDTMMTPRPRMVWLDLQDSNARNREKMLEHRHSRYPVCDGGFDEIVGMVDVRDLWPAEHTGSLPDLRAHLTRPLFVPETMPALRLLETFRKTGVHFALVIDEFGGTQGLVTLNDVLEEITGNLTGAETRFHQRADGSWLVDASVSMAEFWAGLGLEERRAEERHDYITLGGFVLSQLGHVPHIGESFEALGLRFEIVDLDGHRIDKLLIAENVGGRDSG